MARSRSWSVTGIEIKARYLKFPSDRTTTSNLVALIDQPTHFDPGRHYGVFSVTVPKDFGTKRLTYTISVNNQPQTISAWTSSWLPD